MTISDFTETAPAIVAVLSIAWSIYSVLRQRKFEDLQRQLGRENLRIHRDTAIRAWTDSVISTMAEGERLVAHSRQPEEERNEQITVSLASLSALIDQGRMLFPNVRETEVGLSNPDAYKGKRQPILDAVFDFFSCLKTMKCEPDQKAAALIDIRRRFVSEAQTILSPRSALYINDVNRIRQEGGFVPAKGVNGTVEKSGAAGPAGATSRQH